MLSRLEKKKNKPHKTTQASMHYKMLLWFDIYMYDTLHIDMPDKGNSSSYEESLL